MKLRGGFRGSGRGCSRRHAVKINKWIGVVGCDSLVSTKSSHLILRSSLNEWSASQL